FFPIKTTLSATLSSQIFTLPILIYNFGRISLLSPIVNILIVPILSPLTILIFIFGFLGMISWILGYLFSFPVWLFLEYIVKIIDLFSKIPFTSFKIENVSYIYLIIFYFVLILFIIMENRKEKLKFLNY
ncbi:MAG TPA: ComEC/Rec2 family competence protein, partial [Candidatus Pacearchaeota archaeon]|nr:ComEC/Rec2 family competence protein [Candidatus Pacearchaeota archaeon]